MTVLKLKMAQGVNQQEVDIVENILADVSGASVSVTHEHTMEGPIVVLKAFYDDPACDLSNHIKQLIAYQENDQNITSKLFAITLESDIIDPSLMTLLDERISNINDQMHLMNHIFDDLIDQQENLESKLDALYQYINKSGLLTYKETIDGIYSVLEQNNMITKKTETTVTSH